MRVGAELTRGGQGSSSGRSAAGRGKPACSEPLAFTFGNWFAWTATGVALPALGFFLLTVADVLAAGTYESLPVLAAAHIVTLGWATMTIMGAAMQMGPALLAGRVKGTISVIQTNAHRVVVVL